ncbi:hypothetical protein Aduo_007699 [Ancylostoma duodenale]
MDTLDLFVYVNRYCSGHKISESSDDINEWNRLQARELADMPNDVSIVKNHVHLFRLTTLLEQLSRTKVENLTKKKLSSLTHCILLVATTVFNGTCGQLLKHTEFAKIRFDLKASIHRFYCRKCTRLHSLSYHLRNAYGAELNHRDLPLIDFSINNSGTPTIAIEQVWVGSSSRFCRHRPSDGIPVDQTVA